MPEVNEKDVFNALLQCKGSGKISIKNTEIDISLRPVDNHNMDSPDCVLWADISIKILNQNLTLRIPIPVEAEKSGSSAALEDLEKFVKREKFIIEMPMLVVAESGFESRERKVAFPVRFTINQIPIRLLKEKSQPVIENGWKRLYFYIFFSIRAIFQLYNLRATRVFRRT
jgi:hypothetical protein